MKRLRLVDRRKEDQKRRPKQLKLPQCHHDKRRNYRRESKRQTHRKHLYDNSSKALPRSSMDKPAAIAESGPGELWRKANGSVSSVQDEKNCYIRMY